VATHLLSAAFNRYAKILSTPRQATLGGTALHINVDILDPSGDVLGVNTSYVYNVSFDTSASPTVQVVSRTSFGAIYALETISQLIDVTDAGEFTVCSSEGQINDYPRFNWRGLMIDTGRRFFPKALVERILDAMSYSKMNVLHLHFAEEGGFRVESKVYPELTKGVRHYTQEELKEMLEYARVRGIRIVPETDLPMHSSDLRPLEKHGLSFCNSTVQVELYNNPANNNTARVIKALLTEMMQLFPDQVFHIGTDEMIAAPKYPDAGPCTVANIRSFEQQLIQHVRASGKLPMAWHDVLTTSGAAIPFRGELILDTWYAARDFGAFNATALGYQAVENSFMYIVPGNNKPGMNETSVWTALWRDIAPGFSDEQMTLMLGGEVSVWCNDYCSWIGRYGWVIIESSIDWILALTLTLTLTSRHQRSHYVRYPCWKGGAWRWCLHEQQLHCRLQQRRCLRGVDPLDHVAEDSSRRWQLLELCSR
jgi:hexosaminidase